MVKKMTKQYINMGNGTSFCNCAYNGSNLGGKGTTVWFSDDFTLGGYQEYSLSFTDTVPDCCDGGTDLCLVTYELTTDAYSANSIVIWRHLNNVVAGSTTHSLVAGHNVMEAFDLVPLNQNQTYVHGGLNTFKLLNASPTAVQVRNFRIFRAYPLRDLGVNGQSQCTEGSDTGTNGTIDYSRQDYPCHYASLATV